MRSTLGLVCLCLAACTGTPSTAPITPTDVTPPPPDPTTPPPPAELALALPPAQPAENARFASSDSCADCHGETPSGSTTNRDNSDRSVAPHDLWQSSMMANASRDPLWRAVVSAEIVSTPGAADQIGRRCMNCHAPMAYSDAILDGLELPSVDTLSLETVEADLALDGVSCSLCHQIEPVVIGDESVWKGNYQLNDARILYGPYDATNTGPMTERGWTAQQGGHVRQAEQCGTCHTLITQALNADGTPNGGAVVEQATLLEMRNSSSASSNCQSCHFPRLDADGVGMFTRIATNEDGSENLALPQRQVGRHLLVGGNTLIPQLFRDWPDLLNPSASPEAFQATIDAARSQLTTSTARVAITESSSNNGTVSFNVDITSTVGHKFPSGIPVRRAFLHVRMWDGTNAVVFESGATNDRGQILKNGSLADFEVAGGPLEPHHDLIESADQVQVYEAVLSDLDGDPTFRLLQGAGFAKDNRLLPPGWSFMHPDIDRIAPAGVDGDTDYQNGGDIVRFAIPTTTSGPYTVEAKLLYQPLAHRFAEELYLADTPQTRGLRVLLDSADTRPELVSTTSTVIP